MILLLNQFFYPDSAATSQLLTDLARELARRGHDVTAICGGNGYGLTDATEAPPVTIHRAQPLPFSRLPFMRIASYATFLCGAAVRSICGRAPDTSLTLTTPPLLGIIGTLTRRIRGARHFIWEMDLYPDIAEDLSIFRRHSFSSRLVGAVADYIRRNADGIIALGDDMKERLVRRGVPESKIHVIHNWADGQEIQPLPWHPLPLTIHYSGNLGLAHETQTIRDAMLALRDDLRFRFVFAGGGAQRKDLEAFCRTRNLNQTEFRPYCQRAELSQSLSEGHLGLVTQKLETVGSVVPSKIYGIMAAGRPILYIGPRHATPARIIERFACGWHMEPGNCECLVALLNRLVHCPEEIRSAGERARQAFLENFDRPLGVRRIASVLGA
ncbi:MAG TPA: glycosyltransferase family 4 protein [Bryobacteraceae bacterium]